MRLYKAKRKLIFDNKQYSKLDIIRIRYGLLQGINKHMELIGSDNDKRDLNIEDTTGYDWNDPSTFRALMKLSDNGRNQICHILKIRKHTSNVIASQQIMDGAFDAGWTNELSVLDEARGDTIPLGNEKQNPSKTSGSSIKGRRKRKSKTL